MVYLSVGCGELCLQIRLSVRWLGGYVWYWVCLFVGWWLCDNIISFNSRDGVSVGLFNYRFKANGQIIGHIGSLFIYFFLCGLLLLCVLPWVICFMFGVVWV